MARYLLESSGSNDTYIDKVFPKNEMFTWDIFFCKLFGIDQYQHEFHFDKKCALILIEYRDKLHNNLYQHQFMGSIFYRHLRGTIASKILKRYFREPSDEAKFKGTQATLGLGYLLNSLKVSLKEILKHGPRSILIYHLWKITFFELILHGFYREARDYVSFIIINIFIMFA